MTLTIAFVAVMFAGALLVGAIVLVEAGRQRRLGRASFPAWLGWSAGVLAVVGFVGSAVLAWKGYR